MLSNDLVPSMSYGKVFVVSAPAGTGKTTLAKRLVNTFSNIVHIPTTTTRSKREDEVAGKDYMFVSEEEFLSKIEQGDLLEHIQLYGNYYGTSKQDVDTIISQGKHALLVIDTQGAQIVKQQYQAVSIFIKPPSMDELISRLQGRATEDTAMREKRIAWAKYELLQEKGFDYVLVNDSLERAFTILASIVIAETHTKDIV